MFARQGRYNSHLRVEEASVGLNDAHCLVEGLKGECRSLFVSDHSREIQSQILGLKVGGEAVADAVLFTCRYIDAVPGRSEIAND